MKKAVLALLAGGLVLPAAVSAGRLDGNFNTEDSTVGTDNEMCVVVDGTDFAVAGEAQAVNGDCTVHIFYATRNPHKANASTIKSGKTDGTAKVSQSVETDVVILIDGAACTTTYLGSADPEKCKASGSIKGTSVDDGDDTVQSSSGSVSCELGENGSELDGPTGPPTTDQISTIVGAFGDRKDVKFEAPKKGKLQIKHKGLPATGSVTCLDTPSTTTVPTTTTTTAAPTTTTAAPTTTTTTTTLPPV